MDVDQALAIIDQGLAAAPGNRADHAAFIRAHATVSAALKPPAEVPVED